MNYFSVVFVTGVNFAGASFTRRHVKERFRAFFLYIYFLITMSTIYELQLKQIKQKN